MTLKEFLDKLDAGDWGELHVLFFEHLRKDVLQELWDEHQERATLLILAADLPAEVRAQVLPPPAGGGLSSWAWVSAALRLQGIDPERLSAEEGLALLSLKV
jgi:hypothetical protein